MADKDSEIENVEMSVSHRLERVKCQVKLPLYATISKH